MEIRYNIIPRTVGGLSHLRTAGRGGGRIYLFIYLFTILSIHMVGFEACVITQLSTNQLVINNHT